MEKRLVILCEFFVAVHVCRGVSLRELQEQSACGNWVPLNFEKCIILDGNAGLQTQEESERMCQSYSKNSRLLTIKTQEEQDLVTEFLFYTNDLVDDVWLGLKQKENGGKFEWNDGSDLDFTNWANQTKLEADHRCVELSSGKGYNAAGIWVKADCRKRMIVVCETPPILSLEMLKGMILQQNVYLQEQNQDLQNKLKTLEQRNVDAQKQINTLSTEVEDLKEKNANAGPPMGFIYAQLPGQHPPTLLWPHSNWTDVSSQYRGLFFRILGGDSAPFGQIQEADTSRLEQVNTGFDANMDGTTKLPSNGTWSGHVYTGHSSGEASFISLKFRLSNKEIRPRNQAVMLWQCLG